MPRRPPGNRPDHTHRRPRLGIRYGRHPRSTVVGHVRHYPGFRSRHTGYQRDIWVYLPPGYFAERRQRYPVLYCQDGQNMMDRVTSYLGVEWELDEALDAGIRAREITPLIAVCVANTPSRYAEYTPTIDPYEGGGRART